MKVTAHFQSTNSEQVLPERHRSIDPTDSGVSVKAKFRVGVRVRARLRQKGRRAESNEMRRSVAVLNDVLD